MTSNIVSFAGLRASSSETISFLGIKISLITPDALVDLAANCIVSRRKVVIAHHNLHSLCLHSASSPEASSLRRFYEEAHYTLADGMSMVLLGKMYGQQIESRHRVAYNDWLPYMLPVAVQKRWRIFYLGSAPDAVGRGAEVLRNRFPGLKLKVHHGHFDAQHGSEDTARVLDRISDYQPDLLFVGMGMPRQERWILENLRDIDATIILTSGATLDYIAGTKRMAPRWMGKLGLEWAFRLATEPRRLAYRYLVEPWGLLGAVVRNSLTGTKEAVSPIGSETSE
jgi:N-acetylglucosaminyldiphosphoundecaprenol N-acetyl-beta-D-mannosaminyltransferase